MKHFNDHLLFPLMSILLQLNLITELMLMNNWAAQESFLKHGRQRNRRNINTTGQTSLLKPDAQTNKQNKVTWRSCDFTDECGNTDEHRAGGNTSKPNGCNPDNASNTLWCFSAGVKVKCRCDGSSCHEQVVTTMIAALMEEVSAATPMFLLQRDVMW